MAKHLFLSYLLTTNAPEKAKINLSSTFRNIIILG